MSIIYFWVGPRPPNPEFAPIVALAPQPPMLLSCRACLKVLEQERNLKRYRQWSISVLYTLFFFGGGADRATSLVTHMRAPHGSDQLQSVAYSFNTFLRQSRICTSSPRQESSLVSSYIFSIYKRGPVSMFFILEFNQTYQFYLEGQTLKALYPSLSFKHLEQECISVKKF